MVHGDPQQRSARLAEVTEILKREAQPEERELLLSLAPILFGGMPARLALDLPAPAVAARVLLHFRFVAREMPPGHQLYKGLPGIHVSVRNPSEEEARALGGGAGLPLETTIVETHTPDRPFIFDSVKNYLQKCGLRVYSAIHPIFTVRRQWERIVSLGGPQEEGSRESYCFFQIEPLASRERVRRVEHEVFSLLKAVFLAVDDFQDMGRACRELVPRLRSRRGDAAELALRPRLPRVAARRQLHLHGHRLLRGGARRDGEPGGRDRERRLHRPHAPPGRVPRRRRARRGAPAPSGGRRPGPGPRFLRQRLRHLPPGADRGPDRARVGRGREAQGPHPAARPLRPRRFRAARRPHPHPQGEGGPAPRALRGHPELARLARDPGHLQPLPQDRPLLRGRGRPRADHPAHRARGERRRDRGRGPQGGRLRGPLRGLLEAALRLPDRGGAAAGLRGRVRAGGVRHVGRLRPGHPPHLLLRLEPARAPGGPRGGAPADRAAGDGLGGPRRRRPRARVRGARGPAALPPLRDPGVAQRPLPRGDGAGAGAERPPQAGGPGEPARGRRRAEDVGDGLRAAVLGARPRPHRHPEDDAEPRPHRHRGAAHPAHPARGPALLPVPIRRRGVRRPHRRAAAGRAALRGRPCARSTRSARPTTR